MPIVTFIMTILSLISVGGILQCIFFPERGGGLVDIIAYVLIIYITCKMINRDDNDEDWKDRVKHYPRDDD